MHKTYRADLPDTISRAAYFIQQGGMVVFPTQSLYGLGVDALNSRAVDRLYEIKGRPRHKPILTLIHDMRMLHQLVQNVPAAAWILMEKFWPGSVTLVFEAREALPVNLTGGTGKIGVRWCGHPAAHSLVRATGVPITGTSANLSGQTGCSEISQLDITIAAQADLILDAGSLQGGPGSTVVDVTGDHLIILREGSVPSSEILNVLKP